MKKPELETRYGLDSIEFRIKFYNLDERQCLRQAIEELSKKESKCKLTGEKDEQM